VGERNHSVLATSGTNVAVDKAQLEFNGMKKTTSRAKVSTSQVAADILQQFNDMVKPEEKPKATKAQKWELPLSVDAAVDAERWSNAKALFDLVEARVDSAKSDFCDYATKIMAEKIFANKSKPSNPIILLKDLDGKTVHQCQFTMMDKFKFGFGAVPEDTDPKEHFVSQFVDVGIHPTDAERLVDTEIDFSPIQGFRPLNELLQGHYGEKREWIEADEATKEAGRKLIKLLMWNGDSRQTPEALTIEEKKLVTSYRSDINVRAGFYDRVSSYCQSVEQLMAIFKLIQPIVYLAYLKYAVQDSEKEKAERLTEVAREIVG
jgi:hypothetical protein